QGGGVVARRVERVGKGARGSARPGREPGDRRERQKLALASVAPESDPQGALEALLASPSLASKAWIVRQYDSLVQGNTAAGPGGDAAVVRVKRPDGTATRLGPAPAPHRHPPPRRLAPPPPA